MTWGPRSRTLVLIEAAKGLRSDDMVLISSRGLLERSDSCGSIYEAAVVRYFITSLLMQERDVKNKNCAAQADRASRSMRQGEE